MSREFLLPPVENKPSSFPISMPAVVVYVNDGHFTQCMYASYSIKQKLFDWWAFTEPAL